MRPPAPHPRRVGIFAAAVVVGLVATLLLTIAVSVVIGQKVVVIRSSTMEPALSQNDLLIERQVAPGEASTGDIITFSEPGTGRSLTRRVQAIAARGDRVVFVTRGDSSATLERFSLPADGQIGRPTRKVPLAGALASPWALLILPVAGLLVLAAFEVSRRRRGETR